MPVRVITCRARAQPAPVYLPSAAAADNQTDDYGVALLLCSLHYKAEDARGCSLGFGFRVF